MRKLNLIFFLCLLNLSCLAASFASKDNSFSIPLPNKWQKSEIVKDEVLKLKNKDSQIIFSALKQCNTLKCLENTITKRVKQLKKQKAEIIKNTYSGEEIKKTEFSTLDPMLYFSYKINGNDYTEGYFLADSKGYKVEISGLTYLETERNIIPIIEPKPKEIEDLPILTEEPPLIEESIIVPEIKESERQPLATTFANKENFKTEKIKANNPSKKVTITMLLIIFYVFIAIAFFAFNSCFSQIPNRIPTNPKSFYPIRGNRLYGSPDMFLKVYDSQGHNFIITYQRWSSFLKEYGFYGAILFMLVHFVLKSMPIQGNILLNTASSLSYLFVILSIIFMAAGLILDIIFPAPIFVYTDKGTVMFKIIRRRKGLLKYSYLVLTNAYTVVFSLETPKFFLKRHWVLFDNDKQLAVIKEKSLIKSLARKLFGHFGGTFRSNYIIEGNNESQGQITSLRSIKTDFEIDINKPQAIPPDALIAASAIMYTTYRDRYYPWFN